MNIVLSINTMSNVTFYIIEYTGTYDLGIKRTHLNLGRYQFFYTPLYKTL